MLCAVHTMWCNLSGCVYCRGGTGLAVRQVPHASSPHQPHSAVWLDWKQLMPSRRALPQVLLEVDQKAHQQQGGLGETGFQRAYKGPSHSEHHCWDKYVFTSLYLPCMPCVLSVCCVHSVPEGYLRRSFLLSPGRFWTRGCRSSKETRIWFQHHGLEVSNLVGCMP